MRTRDASFGRLLLLLVTASLFLTAASGQVPVNQWQPNAPGNDGKWDTGGNWSLGHEPTSTEKAVIPANSGTIVLPDKGANVRGLELQGSAGANSTNVTGGPPAGVDTKILFGDQGMSIGAGAKVSSPDGLPGMPGGTVDIWGNGVLTNYGEIDSGSGSNSGANIGARPAGDVKIHCKKLINNNVINTGHGGNATTGGDGCDDGHGREGGDIWIWTDDPTSPTELGHANAGDGGNGAWNHPFGRGGRIFLNNSQVHYVQGLHIGGTHIALTTTHPLDLSGATADSFIALGGTIRIDAPSVILAGIAAGTQVFHATEVCLPLNLVLDQGVSIQSLCGSAIVHVGAHCGAGSAFPVLGQETFDEAAGGAPSGFVATTLQGPSGFSFVSATTLPGTTDSRFGCKSAIASAAANGGAPTTCLLETPPIMDPRIGVSSVPLVVQWDQRFQTSPGSSGLMSIVVNNVPTPIFNINATTALYDFVQLDITPFLPPLGTSFSLRWRFQGAANAFWLLDDIDVLSPVPLPIGQPATPGVALFNINDARNANNQPVALPVPGPFTVDVPLYSFANIHIEGLPNGTATIGQGFIMPGALTLPGIGLLDLDLSTASILGTFPISPAGTFDLPVFIPAPLSGLTLGLQAALTSPAGGTSLSNAVEVRFGP